MKIKELNGKFVVTDFDEFEAYRVACKIEEDGISFYGQFLQSVRDPGTKNMLGFLIGEENKHLKFFTDCLTGLRGKKEDLSEDNDLLTAMDYGIFDQRFTPDNPDGSVQDIGEMRDFGIKAEDASIRFYDICRKKVSDQETRKALNNIIAEEKKHKALLEEIRL